MLSYHSEQESNGTCSAKQAFVPPPIGGQEVSCGRDHQASPRRFGECAEHTYFAKSRPSRSGCHNPCLNTNVAVNLLLSLDASLQSPQSLLRAILYRVHSQLQQLLQAGLRLLQREYCVLRHSLPCPWGSARYSPPKTSLAHSGIGRLPFEIYSAKFGTIGNKSRPNLVEQTLLCPSLKNAMNGTVVGKFFGQLIPLTTASHTKDYRIQRSSLVDTLASGMLWRIEFSYNWFYVVPQFFRHMPNCWQRLYFMFCLHLCILSISLHRCYRLNYAF
jgi:hypothetical protein